VVWFTGFALTGTELERRLMSDLGLAMMLIVTVVSAIHLATVVAPVSVRRIRALAALERRRFAGELIARDPDWARQVGIGRPHLARGYDDGGLVDPNEVPAGVLTRIPGVTPQHAALIVTEREHHGPYRTVEDLGRRRLFPSPVPPAVAEFLVILPPAGGAR